MLAVPASLLAGLDHDTTCNRMGALSSLADLQSLVDSVITDVAHQHPEFVGTDITGVTILPFEKPVVDIVYLHRSAMETFEGFTPWMIGGIFCWAPAPPPGHLRSRSATFRFAGARWGLKSSPTGREAPVTEGLVFSFRPQVNRESW